MSCKCKNKLERIFEGWKHVFWPDPLIEKIAKQRAEICLDCRECITVAGLDICKKCGCPLTAKCRSLSEECDIGKWKAENITTHV